MQHDHGEFYKSPSFQFYAADFVNDVQHLEADEIGAYIMLLAHAWEHQGIPKELRRIANIGKIEHRQSGRVWGALGGFWRPHPACTGCLINPRLEAVRDEARQYAELRSKQGRAGAEARWRGNLRAAPSLDMPEHSPGNADALPEQSPDDASAMRGTMPERCGENGSPVSGLQLAEPPSSALPASAPQAAQPRIPLDADLMDRRRAILARVWGLIEPTGVMAGAKGKTEWGKQNGRIALDLAREGATPEQCEIAWHSATSRLGSPVRTMQIVQDELVRLASTAVTTISARAPRTGDGAADLDSVIKSLQGQRS